MVKNFQNEERREKIKKRSDEKSSVLFIIIFGTESNEMPAILSFALTGILYISTRSLQIGWISHNFSIKHIL